MAASVHTPEPDRPAQVIDQTSRPSGVVPKRAQHYLVIGIAVVIVLIAMFSSNRQHKSPTVVPSALTPVVHEPNEHKLADYSAELAQQRPAAGRPELPPLPPPSNSLSTYASTGGSSSRANNYEGANAEAANEEAAQRAALHANEQERLYKSRFASNIAFAFQPPPAAAAPGRSVESEPDEERQPALQRVNSSAEGKAKKPVNVNVNGAYGQPYVLFEGTLIETTLVTRLDGDFSGPVKVMVTNPVYSHDRQHVLIPEGSGIVGEVKPVQSFGQRRLAVVFHRIIMPDGFTVDLDQFEAMNQVGETGLKDQVNNHYAQIFGSSIALGVIAGAAESSTSNVGLYASGSDAYRTGVASNVSQTSTRVLDKFLNISPTLTIREGQRIKIYLRKDLLLPAYENHMVPPNI